MTLNAVVTPHRLSAEAGRQILLRGGNAVDAAIAAVAAQGVVAPETSGIGGDLFALIHSPGWDRPRTLNASGRSGSLAEASMLRDHGVTEVPRDHRLTVTIPGCVDGLEILSAELGSLPLGVVLEPAITLAEEGFEVSTEQAAAFRRLADMYRANRAVSDFYPDGEPVDRGDLVSRHDLAATLTGIAHGGRQAFYEGMAGEDIVAAVGGLITMDDLAENQAEWVEPIGVSVAGLTAWTVPPNSQGYLGPATLAVFEMLDPPSDSSDPLWWHLLIEAYRSLAWERNDLVSDPRFAQLPDSLLMETARLERIASTVSRDETGLWPARMGQTSGTAYLCTADSSGMAVSLIQSNYRGTGSPFGAARSGFLLQDRGGGFGLTPGHPNELGPNKRPLHTLSPTLWTDGPDARWVLGTRGGSLQPQFVAQVAARSIFGDEALAAAQTAPRWAIADFGPHSPPQLSVEPGVPATIVDGLTIRGHRLSHLSEPQPGWGPLSIIGLELDRRLAAADPRVDTTAALVF